MSKSESKNSKKGSSVRINSEDAKLLKSIRARIKSKPGVGNVRAGEIVAKALRLFGEAEVREMQEQAMTARHRKEQLRQKYVALRGPISLKEFEKFMVTAEYAEFLLEQRKLESAA